METVDWKTAVIYAIEDNDIDKLEKLVPKKKDSIKEIFLLACQRNKTEIAKQAFDQDNGSVRKDDYQSLKVICQNGLTEILRHVFHMIPPTHIRSVPFMMACANDHLEIVEIMSNIGIGYLVTCHISIARHPLRIIKYLIEEKNLSLKYYNTTNSCSLLGEAILADKMDNADYFLSKDIKLNNVDIREGMRSAKLDVMIKYGADKPTILNVLFDIAGNSQHTREIITGLFITNQEQ